MKKIAVRSVFETLLQFRTYFQGDSLAASFDNEEPFHSELYSSERLNRHGQTTARSHRLLDASQNRDRLLGRLEDNEETLLKVRVLLVDSIKNGKSITPGAEWLLDNFYLIEEQIALARKHLPKGYSEGLPYLSNGLSSGLPRVYNIVLEIISHSDGRVDIGNLTGFLEAYQSQTELTLGELWAVPIMLRLAAIENLRRVCGKIAMDMIDHNLADYWTERMITAAREDTGDLFLTTSDMARARPALSNPFVASFTRNLQGKGPSFALPLSWLDQQLSRQGLLSTDLVRHENQKQAADQVSVRNSIGTLRFIGSTDWRLFVESLSKVEQILKQDPAGIYPLMDFATRDTYRHRVEMLAKGSSIPETAVAEKIILLAKQGQSEGRKPKQGHVGYYLIDAGIRQLRQSTGIKYSIGVHLAHRLRKRPLLIYLSAVTLITAAAGTWMFSAGAAAHHSLLFLVFLAAVCIAGAAQMAIALVNWLSTLVVYPKLLPRLDFSKGIPKEFRTLVVVPTMLSGARYIDELIEGLEIRFLANKDQHLHFALLTDFLDADKETLPEDDPLVSLANERIAELNFKYKQSDEDIFFLFHRPRTWNRGEQKWMGHERKRGKLAALNALLKGKSNSQFTVITGNPEILLEVKYVITLDSDTQLPRESAWKFVATMAHPLNHPVFDERKKRVTEGYGILQPRVEAYNPEGITSLYMQMQGDLSGVDPYTRVSSDVYQDLFGEGSFIGKGIYDVEVFEQSLANVFPDNRVLSHDLLEGCYARAGLLSDVFLYEGNPSEYGANLKRHYRWIRGDWQIGLWILPVVAGYNDSWTRNRLSLLSKWKIFDNLRRSLLPPALITMLLFGWFVLPFPAFWTTAVAIIILLPVAIISGWQLIHKPIDLALKAHLAEMGVSLQNTAMRFVFGLAILPHEAMKYTDAIIRTNWRLLFSGKNLLQWTPSANAGSGSIHGYSSAYKVIWAAPLLAVLCSLLLLSDPNTLLIATPVLFLWLIAPALVWMLSRPQRNQQPELPAAQTRFLHDTARKTWAFFERFVTEEDNWLPPDNFQEDPVGVIAHRTSPTNMGLALLANLTAYDFGYITQVEMIQRCDNTLSTMNRLERYLGHFYNWYDTVSLEPLRPQYVSAVDSGNLVGHLLTLRQGLLAIADEPILHPRRFEGLLTTLRLAYPSKKIRKTAEAFFEMLITGSWTPLTLKAAQEQLQMGLQLINELPPPENETNGIWIGRLKEQAVKIMDDLALLAPWQQKADMPEGLMHIHAMETIPTLRMIRDWQEHFPQLLELVEKEYTSEELAWLSEAREAAGDAASVAAGRMQLCELLAEQCDDLPFYYG
ncbi:MAG: hypothetical protein EOP49_02325 [Sphingobacteriales bacterium]|nr:MAG: hypothetical protein EOP49_02325 [Sphingobacteriales bacterium]